VVSGVGGVGGGRGREGFLGLMDGCFLGVGRGVHPYSDKGWVLGM
jgi:hypothetical protein